MIIYAHASKRQKIFYWSMTVIRTVTWVGVVWYITSHAPIASTYVDRPVGIIEMPIELLMHDAQIQLKRSLMETVLTLGWAWNLYLIFSECIPVLPRKLLMVKIQDTLKRSMIACTIVICAYMAYMLSL